MLMNLQSGEAQESAVCYLLDGFERWHFIVLYFNHNNTADASSLVYIGIYSVASGVLG